MFFVYGLNAFMPSRALYQADSLDSFFRLYSSRTTYWRSLARTILGPVLVNILLYHLLLSPEGLGGALIAAVFWFVLYFHYRCLTGNAVNEHAVARRTQRELQVDGSLMIASVSGCEPTATLAAKSGYLNGSGVKCTSMQYGKDVDRRN